jgi:hypothetical protein
LGEELGPEGWIATFFTGEGGLVDLIIWEDGRADLESFEFLVTLEEE